MKALLIIWLWNAGELALTSEPMPDLATCETVLTATVETMNAHKTLKGMNRGAYGVCVKVQ